jgi:hypothetical protein
MREMLDPNQGEEKFRNSPELSAARFVVALRKNQKA